MRTHARLEVLKEKDRVKKGQKYELNECEVCTKHHLSCFGHLKLWWNRSPTFPKTTTN